MQNHQSKCKHKHNTTVLAVAVHISTVCIKLYQAIYSNSLTWTNKWILEITSYLLIMHTNVTHCCSEPVKSAHLGCTLAYPPPADPDTLAPAVSGSALSVWCRPSLFPIKTRVFSSNCLCGCVFVSVFVWEWYWPHDWRRLSFIVLWKTF